MVIDVGWVVDKKGLFTSKANIHMPNSSRNSELAIPLRSKNYFLKNLEGG
jgi:hypothetical protein